MVNALLRILFGVWVLLYGFGFEALAAPISSSSLPFIPEEPPAPSPSAVQQAIAAFRQGDVAEAVRRLESARAASPDLAPVKVMLANFYFSSDQPALGRQTLEAAVLEEPTDPEANLIFGDLAWRERRLSDAYLQYSRGRQLLAKLSGDTPRKQNLELRTLAGLANVAEARGQYAEAVELFGALLKREPNHAQARFRLGSVLFELDRPEESLAEFRQACALLPEAPPAALALAELYGKSGNAKESKRLTELAIKEAPTDLRGPIAMARWQLEFPNDPKAAAQAIDLADKIQPNSPEVLQMRGMIAWRAGELAEAEQHFEGVVLKQPSNPTANCSLASVLAERGGDERLRRALETMQLTAARYPRSAEVAAAAAWVALQRGDLAQCENALRAAAVAGDTSRDTAFYRAKLLFRQGSLEQAQQQLKQTLAAQGMLIHTLEAEKLKLELGLKDEAAP